MDVNHDRFKQLKTEVAVVHEKQAEMMGIIDGLEAELEKSKRELAERDASIDKL